MHRMLLRSVNLRYDLAVPERLSHYRPTSRSLAVVRAVMRGDASMAVAAYGSGKSLAAGVGALIVRNDPSAKAALRPVSQRLSAVDPDLYEQVVERQQSMASGRTVVLAGYERDIAGAFDDCLQGSASPNGSGRARSLLDSRAKLTDALDSLSDCDADHVAIVWDEFGRHIEGLIAEGRTHALQDVQTIAEWTARAKHPSASLVLLMHQTLLAYAGGLNQTTRGEWRKVEGRFRHIQFIEDSRELYALISDVVKDRRPAQFPTTHEAKLRQIAKRAIESRWFDGERDVRQVQTILRRGDPVTAAALQTLPRVLARVGQNERSLFSFVEEARLDSVVGTTEVYEAFSDTMRNDVGIGGTHRRWVETENALSRTADSFAREALTAACLFQLGTDGERRRLSRRALELALASRHGCGIRHAASTVQSLIDRKLLIHRRAHDDVSIWCGADVDLATKIRDYRAGRIDSFKVVPFLEQHHSAPFVRPSRHNEEFGTVRYLAGSYVTAAEVLDADTPRDLTHEQAPWGHVLYVVAERAKSLSRVRDRIEGEWADPSSQIVFVVPNQLIPINDAALEVEALLALRKDDVILGEDPLVSQEIDDLLAVARGHLNAVLHRLSSDRSPDTSWFAGGTRLSVSPESPAGVAVSRLMDSWYPRTPAIANDQLMRNQLSRQMRTARVRLILRVMENAQQARLGYGAEDSSAEASVYRTVLERTGLHISNGSVGRFARADEISCAGVRRCWEIIQAFFQEPSKTEKSLGGLVLEMRSPPIGMPMGVMPVVVMAGYRAFARTVSLRTDGEYVTDLLGFNGSNMFDDPSRHTITVFEADEAAVSYLAELAYVFSHARMQGAQDDELVRFASDALNAWKATVPSGAWRSALLSDNSRMFLRMLASATDPGNLLLEDLPNAFGGCEDQCRYRQTVATVERVRNEVDGLIEGYSTLAIGVIAETLSIGSRGDTLARVGDWIRCLDVNELRGRGDLRMTDKAILRTASDTLNGRYTPQSLARSLSSILLQLGFEQWQDSTVDQFRMLLRECKGRIEDAALSSVRHNRSIAPLVHARIRELEEILRSA